MRDAINFKAMEAFVERTGKELHWYHAIDTHKKSVIMDLALIESLEGQHSGQTKQRLIRLPLVIGMLVAVNQNFDVRAGVVNGSWGIPSGGAVFYGQPGPATSEVLYCGNSGS